MLNTNNIVRDSFRDVERMMNESKLERTMEEQLGFFYQKRLERLRNLITTLKTEIEKEPGWKYIDNGFECRSDFHYDPNYEQITYHKNRVSLDQDDYVCETNSDKEKTFVNTYAPLLYRLKRLVDKKENIIIDQLSTVMSKLSPFDLEEIRHPKRYSTNTSEAFVQMKANAFTEQYGVEGISELIKWLNVVGNATRPMDVYKLLESKALPKALKTALFEWLSTYTTGGEELYARYYDMHILHRPVEIDVEKENKNGKVIAFPYINEYKQM